ncbi:hypothetical protein [Actinocorallia sp. A-T 12471]|uniref:hypothetical protein n=1 Tax=Actinocorallia sp. A-T 12471 TaxID=3089813 RepID=UPI0029CE9342|nr:hypothetical protein [Actinocorallia sp. A-T 12471]MDX6744052.1 hypothetical protein [Actinocorallia sp. A-T 12471]
MVVNRELADTTGPHARSRRHLEIALPEGSSYQPGDYLAVLPRNPPEVVDRALAAFGLARDAPFTLHGIPLTAADLLTAHVALTEPATPARVERLAVTTHAVLAAAESSGRAMVEGIRGGRGVTVLELVERFPGVDFAGFLGLHGALVARRYSISSSPRWDPGRVSLTVAVVRDAAGAFGGSASTYLAGVVPGEAVRVGVVRSGKAFHPPESLATPMVMVCAGTGVAPFRGFLQDRALRAAREGVTPAPSLLFFGCDHPDVDFLYRDEFAAWAAAGIVEVRPAFSAAPRDGVRYVQDRVWRDRVDVMNLLRRDAVFYVCGDGRRMAPAVADTCARVYAEGTGATPGEAEEWLALRLHHGRYRSDAYL